MPEQDFCVRDLLFLPFAVTGILYSVLNPKVNINLVLCHYEPFDNKARRYNKVKYMKGG